jgi:hypothetical protein
MFHVSRQRYINARKTWSYVKCWKCPPHSAMIGFTLCLISDAASWTDAARMMAMRGSAFYFNCLYFLPVEFVHVLCQHFHCLISWKWHSTMLLNPTVLFSILQQWYANHNYVLLMFSTVNITPVDIFYEFSWAAFSHSNSYSVKLTHIRLWRQTQDLQI